MAERFSRQVVETVAKRAGSLCSNPDCGALTSGPAESISKSVLVGEAAHIYGARHGSARYDASMQAEDRGSIVNAIWLCRICHKLVDDDPVRHPAELLFEWKREHERGILSKVGKTGFLLRERASNKILKTFENTSYLAQQIVLDKPKYWEHLLIIELLRIFAAPIVVRSEHLEKGLYSKNIDVVELDRIRGWLDARNREMARLIHAMAEIVNTALAKALGEPGIPGSDVEILAACKLYAECCEGLLSWEETIRFSMLPDDFETVREIMQGVGRRMLIEMGKTPHIVSEMIERAKQGVHKGDVAIKISLPDGYLDKYNSALAKAIRTSFG